MADVLAGLASLQLDEQPVPLPSTRRTSADSTGTTIPPVVPHPGPRSSGAGRVNAEASSSSTPSARSPALLTCELPPGMDFSMLDHGTQGADQAISALDWIAQYADGNWDPRSIPARFELPSQMIVRSPSVSSDSIYSSPGLGGPRSNWTEFDSTLPTSPTSSHPPQLAEEQLTYLREGWLPAPRVADEDERRKALYRSKILQQSSHAILDKIVRLAQKTFSVVTVLIMMCEKDDFPVLSSYGYAAKTGPRGPSLCAHTILQKTTKPFVICDLRSDWRFKNHPFTKKSGGGFRFYAGVPLKSEEGHSLGSLCIIDDKPRTSFSDEESQDLEDLGALVMREIELYTVRQEVLQRTLTTQSVERLSKETMEMKDADITVVSARAAQHVRDALSIDACGLFDLSSFEHDPAAVDAAVPTPTYRIRDDGRNLFADGSSNMAAATAVLSLLGSSQSPVNEHSTSSLSSFTVADHVSVGWFLSTTGAGGQIFDLASLPSWFTSPLPADTHSIILLPIFSIDHTPIALLVAISRDETHEFSSGHRAYLDQVGAIFMSTFLRRALIQSDTAKSIFVSNISHELRTPLHVISGHCELLEQSTLTVEQDRCLRSIASSCTSLSETVNHVLEFSKSAAAHPTGTDVARAAEVSEVDLAHFVEEVVDEVHLARMPSTSPRGFRPNSASSNMGTSSPGSSSLDSSASPSGSAPSPATVETVLDIQPRAQGWFVRIDRAGLRRVLTNLVSNAIKYTASGSITVSLRELPSPPSPTHVKVAIEVSDTGRGMTQQYLRCNLFLPFSQEDSISPGAGLGLAMAKAVVESMPGGQIFVQSEKDVGSKFIVHLSPEVVPGIETPPLTFGDGYEVELVGFPVDVPASAASRAIVEAQVRRWGFQVAESSDRSAPVSPAGLKRITIVDESHGWDTFHLATLPPRLIVLTTNQHISSEDPEGRVFLRLPLGPLKLSLALREVIRIHLPQPVLRLAVPPPVAASLSSVSVAISSSMRSSPSADNIPLPSHPPIDTVTHTRRLSHAYLGSRLPDPSVRPFKILIVDDNAMNRMVLRQFLKKKNCVLAEAENGQIAADLFHREEEEPFDFVLLDLQMPILDGFGSCRLMRQTEQTRSSRSLILALTGLSTSDDRKQAFTAGMDDYLVKPVSLKALWSLLLSHTVAAP